MKCFNRYPDQALCFWLGFLSTGFGMGAYATFAVLAQQLVGRKLLSEADLSTFVV